MRTRLIGPTLRLAACLGAAALAAGCQRGSSTPDATGASDAAATAADGDQTTGSPDAYGATPGADASAALPDVAGLRAAFEEAGFVVQEAAWRPIDLSDCCAPGKSCSGNNPSSPYLEFATPRAPGQTVPNEREDDGGLSPSFHLRADEAFVLIGRTPPTARYFGITPYLVDRWYDGIERIPFASLTDTLNHEVIRTLGTGDSPFGRPFVLVATGNAATLDAVEAVFADHGISKGDVNVIVFDPSQVHFGLEATDDTLAVLTRVAVFADPEAGEAWVQHPDGTLWRLTPATPLPDTPLAAPAPRPPASSPDEHDLGLDAALDALEDALRGRHPGAKLRTLQASFVDAKPATCIQTGASCLGDNRDAAYALMVEGLQGAFTLRSGDSAYVFGVDHVATGKATYANASLYVLSHLAGLRAVSDEEWAGTAAAAFPDVPHADSLFVWRLARSCSDGVSPDIPCTEIPFAPCPEGANQANLLTVSFRAYLEPGRKTAPRSDLLVPGRVLLARPMAP